MFYVLITSGHTELATSQSFATLEEAQKYQSTIHPSIETKILKEFSDSDEREYRAKRFSLSVRHPNDAHKLNSYN